MNEITTAIGMTLHKAVDDEKQAVVQVGEPIGESRAPRVYITDVNFPNAGDTRVVTHMFESGGIHEAFEFPESTYYDKEEGAVTKATELVQGYIDGFPDDHETDLVLEGNDEMIDEVTELLELPDRIGININEGKREVYY